jgi:flagella basal body P-ring formation protein FlgA
MARAEMPAELPGKLTEEVQQLAGEATRAVAGNTAVRIAVEVGQLDPRLKLAACDRVQPYLPTGSKPWGKTRIGLRCIEGSTRWNVFLPVTVHVFGRSLVAAGPLPAGTVLAERDLVEAEVDLAAGPAAPVAQKSGAIGRALARSLAPGDPLHQTDLKARQWFVAGETVRIDVVGGGYAVSTEGQALSPGIEGQPVRVRTGSGRIVSGQPVGERRVELSL